MLREQAHYGDARCSNEQRHDPYPGIDLGGRDREPLPRHALLDLVGDVAAEQVEGAVGHVDDAHEPEDQCEAARDDEERARERERVEHDPQERTGIVHGRPEGGGAPGAAADLGRRLGDEQDVGERECDRGDDDQPGYTPPHRTHEQHAVRVRANGGDRLGHAGSDRNRGSLRMAIASTSIFAPGTASREISTSVLAGRAEPNASWRTGLISGRSSTSVRKTVTLTTSAKLDPPAARTAPRLRKTARACSTTSS